MQKNCLKSNDGAALLLTVFFVSIALLVLTSMALRLVNENLQVTHFEDFQGLFSGRRVGYRQQQSRFAVGGVWADRYGRVSAVR